MTCHPIRFKSAGRLAVLAGMMLMLVRTGEGPAMADQRTTPELPSPRLDGGMSLEEAVLRRRSVRDFSARSIELDQAGQLLWAAQGETDDTGRRASPSAGALYPLELYLVAGSIDGLDAGVYHYDASSHGLVSVASTDRRRALARAALGQSAIAEAAAVIVIGAVYDRTTVKYGDRGRRYVHMEAGHAAQNVLLQATALGLHSVPIGAFGDSAVRTALEMKPGTAPLYLLAVGRSPRD